MSKANNFDLLCAQDIFRLQRDGDEPQAPPKPSKEPHAVMRRKPDGTHVRSARTPAPLR